MKGGALAGLSVLDFSTLLPGPMAGLMLAEAGADVLKVERPGSGDEMRSYHPRLGDSSANFALLNRGKRSIALDLKSPSAKARLEEHLETCDILIEQFRPGVMDRLGLGYKEVSALNPGIIYCSITGWGQDGPHAGIAAHDLNYMAASGLLDTVRGSDGAPVLPPVLAADIAGGTYPAVVNILLALRQREATGRGLHLDIAMADNLFVFNYWALAAYSAEGIPPRPGAELVTGGTPRYAIYQTRDGRYVAAAPLEEKFWSGLCDLLDVPSSLRADAAAPQAVRSFLASRFVERDAAEWAALFATRDVCCNVVSSLEEALQDPQFRHRRLFEREVVAGERSAMALPMPIDQRLRIADFSRRSPSLGQDDREENL